MTPRMQAYPHHYRVTARGADTGDVSLDSPGLPGLSSAPPTEFGGPGDRWSPETLLVGAVADCFVLTFRAIARHAKLEFTSLACDVTGTLERKERRVSFTELVIHAELEIPPDTDEAQARAALERAEQSCLITNSLTARSHLEAVVRAAAVAD